jgi:hypothetical protein
VRRSGLRDFVVRLRFHGVNKVGKFDRVLDEKNRHVVSDEIPYSLFGVELDRKTADVSRRIGGSARTGDRRESDENRRFSGWVAKEARHGQVRQILVNLENAVCGRAAGVHHPLRNALVVEMGDLFS